MPLPLLIPIALSLAGAGANMASGIMKQGKIDKYNKDVQKAQKEQQDKEDALKRKEALARAIGATKMFDMMYNRPVRTKMPNEPDFMRENIIGGLGQVAGGFGSMLPAGGVKKIAGGAISDMAMEGGFA